MTVPATPLPDLAPTDDFVAAFQIENEPVRGRIVRMGQAIDDILTRHDYPGPVAGRTIAWVGDGNNVCSTYIQAAAAFGFRLNIACPAIYHPDLVELARAAQSGAEVVMGDDPVAAVKGADCVVTDTWFSMGHVDIGERMEAFEPYQVDEDLMARAADDAIFLHCLPAHRSEEVVDEVIDGPQSCVWAAAENRIHAQKSILAWCFGAVG